MTTTPPTTGRTEILPKHLVLSGRYQARKNSGQQPLAELAESIAAQGGLLQNLVVVKGKKRGQYEVVAGGRRWTAIQLLMTDGRCEGMWWRRGEAARLFLVLVT